MITTGKSERLAVLNNAEQEALYGLPDFDDAQRLEAEGNDKGIEALTRILPVAWQHILLNGHYTFQSSSEIIDLDELVAGLKLRQLKFRRFRRRTPDYSSTSQ